MKTDYEIATKCILSSSPYNVVARNKTWKKKSPVSDTVNSVVQREENGWTGAKGALAVCAASTENRTAGGCVRVNDAKGAGDGCGGGVVVDGVLWHSAGGGGGGGGGGEEGAPKVLRSLRRTHTTHVGWCWRRRRWRWWWAPYFNTGVVVVAEAAAWASVDRRRRPRPPPTPPQPRRVRHTRTRTQAHLARTHSQARRAHANTNTRTRAQTNTRIRTHTRTEASTRVDARAPCACVCVRACGRPPACVCVRVLTPLRETVDACRLAGPISTNPDATLINTRTGASVLSHRRRRHTVSRHRAR